MSTVERARTFDIVEDKEAGRWIEEGVGTGDISRIVPPIFDRYVRILHPAYYANQFGPDVRISWKKLSEYYSKTTVNPANVDVLTGHSHDSRIEENPVWTTPPLEGSLPTHESWQLIDILAPQMISPLECWFGVWDGFACLGDLPNRSGSRILNHGRTYLLLRGPIYAAARSLCSTQRQTVNLWWNPEHTWCVATDIDLDSTFVGGNHECIQKILDNPDLESIEVSVSDSFQRS